MGERAGGRRWRIGLVLVALGAGCSASPPPQRPAPVASASATAEPAKTAAAIAPAPSSAPAAASVTTIVIHQADLFGEIHGRTGATVHVVPLVATRTPPAVGVKGVLFRGVDGGGDTEWLAIADVTVKKESDGGGNLQLTIDDEKKDALIAGRKVNHFTRGVRVKLRWEY